MDVYSNEGERMELSQLIMFNLLLTFNNAFLTDVEPVNMTQLDAEYVEQMSCLIVNTYHETRGESFEAKVAVAQSVMNRVHDRNGEFKRYSTPCEVVRRTYIDDNGNPEINRCWYSWYCDGRPDDVELFIGEKINKAEKRAWEDSILASFYAYHELYPSLIGDATHYYNYQTANPNWAEHYEVVADVGAHRFLQ